MIGHGQAEFIFGNNFVPKQIGRVDEEFFERLVAQGFFSATRCIPATEYAAR